MKWFYSLCVAILLTACSTLPENLASTDPDIVTDYQIWLSKGTEQPYSLRLGGVVASVTNLDDRTRVEMVNLPISSDGKPNLNVEPSGRFVAYVHGYIEPMSFAEGRLVTFLGNNMGTEKGQVGDFEKTYPVMDVSAFRLWRIQERVAIDQMGSYMYPCNGINCRYHHSISTQGRIIQEVK